MKKRDFFSENPKFLGVLLAGIIATAFFISAYIGATDNSLICSNSFSRTRGMADLSSTPIQLQAILHYATSRIVPQQSLGEIRVSFDVLESIAPCNFLVFGLGHDSLMWSSLNPRGRTVFLEEDPQWYQAIIKEAPDLHAHTVKYKTQLSQADDLIATFRSEPDCAPKRAYLRGNTRCRLALSNLPDDVYDNEWDVIMVDAPKGYFLEAPGRMGAIFSAAVVARNRKGSGVTHVFLHDVDRKVEKMYAEEFLCKKYLVKAVGRLWHFEIPPAANMSTSGGDTFC